MTNGPELVIQKRLRAKRFFRWYDLWIGAFIDTEASRVFICPIPMCGVKIWVEEYATCGFCGQEMGKRAHDTGDGWFLYWDCELCCNDGDDTIIEWPFGDAWMTGEELERFGYELA